MIHPYISSLADIYSIQLVWKVRTRGRVQGSQVTDHIVVVVGRIACRMINPGNAAPASDSFNVLNLIVINVPGAGRVVGIIDAVYRTFGLCNIDYSVAVYVFCRSIHQGRKKVGSLVGCYYIVRYRVVVHIQQISIAVRQNKVG